MPRGVLVDPQADVDQEYYAGVVWDGTRKQPVMIFSPVGGIDIEQVAEEQPDKVGRRHLSNILPLSDFQAKEVIASTGVTGSALNKLVPIVVRLARLFAENDMTLAEINPLGELADGWFVALDAHMEIENEAADATSCCSQELGVGEDETRQAREATPFELAGEQVDATDHRGVAGNVTEFDGNLGLVIGAGGGSLTLFDAVRAHGGSPPTTARSAATRRSPRPVAWPSWCCRSRAWTDRGDDVDRLQHPRGHRRARSDQGLPGARPRSRREDHHLPHPRRLGGGGFKILDATAIDYADRSVSLNEAARRAVEKIQGAAVVMPILIDADTTFIVQGITGREAVNLTRECLDYGAGRRSSAASRRAGSAARSTACPSSTRSPRRSPTMAARSTARS